MSRPAPWSTAVVAQSKVELRLTLRRGENMLAMVGVPIAVLLFVARSGMVGDDLGTLMPRVLAIALVASGLVNLGIATAYERGYGVLKRLGGSPLGRLGLVVAKLGTVLAIAFVQVAGLLVVATALGWEPGPTDPLALVAATILGAGTFAGLGLLIAGTLRPEAALVVANVAFLLAIGFGGVVIPFDAFWEPIGTLLRLLPVGALGEAFSGAAGGSDADVPRSLAILVVWAIGSLGLAARTFRWGP